MIKRIKKWLDDRDNEEHLRQYRAGFEWAMSAHYIDGKDTAWIMCYLCDEQQLTVPFDEGAVHAIDVINGDGKFKAKLQQVKVEFDDVWRKVYSVDQLHTCDRLANKGKQS